MSYQAIFTSVVTIVGLITTAKAACSGDPSVLEDVYNCFDIILDDSTNNTHCVTTEERSRRQSAIVAAEACLDNLFTDNQCEDSFMGLYQSYIRVASSQASIYRCALDCGNDIELNKNLSNCYNQSFSEDEGIIDCELSNSELSSYDDCILDILHPSGCDNPFTGEWFATSGSMWEVHHAVCGRESSCFDNSEFFIKGIQCKQAASGIQLVGFDLEEYCRSSLDALTPCIEDILTNVTCKESFYEAFRQIAFGELEEFCTSQRLCDYRLMECLNATTFTFSVEPSNYDVTCRNLYTALDTGSVCLESDYHCLLSQELLEGLEKSLNYHRDLYFHMCTGGNNCIFDSAAMGDIEACYDMLSGNQSYCGTFETDMADVKKCYTAILQGHTCSEQSVEYYTRWYKHYANRLKAQCNAICTDSVLWQLHTCHHSVATNIAQLTSEVFLLSQKEDFCSSLLQQAESLVSCVDDVFEVEWCEESVRLEELAQAVIYRQIQTSVCDSMEYYFHLALQCDSFESAFGAYLSCSQAIQAKFELMHTRMAVFDITSTVCQETEVLYTQAMQCLTSKLYYINCPVELPASLSDMLYKKTKDIKEYCKEVPVVDSISLFVPSMTLSLAMILLSWTMMY